MSLTNDFWQTQRPASVVGKRRGILTIPAQNNVSPQTWFGVNTVAVQFNISLDNNFTITPFKAIPTLFANNIVAAIRWQDSVLGYDVRRYMLWQGKTANPYPIYNGERIKNKFIVEYWTDGNADLGSMPALPIITSILKDADALDNVSTYQLVAASDVVACSSLIVGTKIGSVFPLPFIPLPCADGSLGAF